MPQLPSNTNKDQFEQWLVAEQPGLAKLLRGKRFSWETAEDAAQEAVLRALDEFQNGVRPQKPLAWLRKITFNAANRQFRKRKRVICNLSVVLTISVTPRDEVAERDERAAVRRAIAALPRRSCSLLTLCALEGRTHEDAASLFGVSPGTINRWLHDARAELRKRLEDHYF